MSMSPHVLLALVIAGLSSDRSEPDARALFLANCATCHGETGDGQGTTVLDRPARSFKDGGFSFGNTPEAIFRTITTGIPGTPMPGFSGALSEDERHAVATYVRTLGPPIDDTASSASVLVVEDRPLVVRGHLPALEGGGADVPRGLLIGTLDGLTFQYRVDDVRLLAVRQGGFVRRADWNGRGGAALEPLGQIVHLVEGGADRPLFGLGPLGTKSTGQRISARLDSTWTRGTEAGLSYRLVDVDGHTFATVSETFTMLSTSVGAGFARHFTFKNTAEPVELTIRVSATGEAPSLAFVGQGPSGDPVNWRVVDRGANSLECIGFTGGSTSRSAVAGTTRLGFSLTRGKALEFTLATLYVSNWNDEVNHVLSTLDVR